jgi:putative ABC transport system permease protein
MNLNFLVWSYLKERPLNTLLNIFLLGLGIGVITLLVLFRNQMEEKIDRNVKGIDLVVGAKGSPLQIILCNIFHIDFPTGNIKLYEADRLAKHRLVKNAIPLALGDSYRGFRIIGTNADYAELYDAEISEGEWFENEMEVAIGHNVASALKLEPGDRLVSTHSFNEDGVKHEGDGYSVKGIIAQNNTVVDNLILTSVESLWKVHETHAATKLDSIDTSYVRSALIPSVGVSDSSRELTSLLIEFRSAMGAIQLPRFINTQTNMQAASPAFESARLFSILGIGVNVLTGFASVLIFISALSIFIALYNALKERRYDMAIMRTMGASKIKLFSSIILEGIAITAAGGLIGVSIAHLLVSVFAASVPEAQKAGLSGFAFYPEEWIILVSSLLMGIVSSVIPALQAYRTDISKVLAGN